MTEWPEHSRFGDNEDDRWYECVACGKLRKRVTIKFISGGTEPQEDETLTGAASGDTGVVDEVEKVSGTWAGGDAAGYVYLKDYTGADEESFRAFQADESINGSVGGNGLITVDSYQPWVTFYGRMYREGDTAVYQGKRYCLGHYGSFIDKEKLDEVRLQGLHERDRHK